ncbi:MAG: endonuclease III domain-containing protein [Dehalococcoidales bacterium]|nr:endonuclease III domain-containing protein [Dehalococcoidales bacterium]
MGRSPLETRLRDIYRRLQTRYGPQHWWPAQTPFEVMVGAILTQSAAWVNVEKAIKNLKSAGVLDPAALRFLPHDALAGLIHSCGYYNVKATKLKALAEWLGRYGDNLDAAFNRNITQLREELLSIFGVGEETADSIILYAAYKPIFVIDSYTRRIMSRLGLAPAKDSYTAYQRLFMDNLPTDAPLFNEYHALLVAHAKNACRTKPVCPSCCLKEICIAADSLLSFQTRKHGNEADSRPLHSASSPE